MCFSRTKPVSIITFNYMVNSQHPVDANASVSDTLIEVLDLIQVAQIGPWQAKIIVRDVPEFALKTLADGSFSTFIPWLSYIAARSSYVSFTEKLKP